VQLKFGLQKKGWHLVGVVLLEGDYCIYSSELVNRDGKRCPGTASQGRMPLNRSVPLSKEMQLSFTMI
jgi:hypothetical protein